MKDKDHMLHTLMGKKNTLILAGAMLCAAFCNAQEVEQVDSVLSADLDEVVVTSAGSTRRLGGAINGTYIGQKELFRAACCNLGESFTANPSVDVSYNDAATGAKQIKLLGLSGTYVQMLTENMPGFRGAAAPFALGYVPGTWMKGISVSKGAASVKNGYESITGQIDIEYLKPEAEKKINFNLYGDIQGRIEANADANFHLSNTLSTNVLAHYENRLSSHDGNHDGFLDMPKVQQGNFSNRWKLMTERYIMHAGVSFLKEGRNSGQTHHTVSHSGGHDMPLYKIEINTDRYEGYMKHAFILNPEKQMNIAVLANASLHKQDAIYGEKGYKGYGVNQKNLYAQLMYEATFGNNAISVGGSINHDYLKQDYLLGGEVNPLIKDAEKETTPGVYTQYTYTLGTKLTAMAGVRWDHSSLYGGFVTPRAHIKYQPVSWFSTRLSAGKGYRTVHALAENHNLLASGRTLLVENLGQEEAWNYGATTAFLIPLGEHVLKLNAEYYYTTFNNQAVIDYDADDSRIWIHDLQGKSRSHVFQVDANYTPVAGLDITAAYRLNDVKCTYGGVLTTKPLTSRYKALLSLSYKLQPLELWQFDATMQLNGGGRLPNDMGTYKAFEQLSAQVTRFFRHFDIYIGGENLTNFKQKNPIINASNPWTSSFEPTLVYGPVEGAMAYMGIRVKL